VPHATPAATEAEPGWTKRAMRTRPKNTGLGLTSPQLGEVAIAHNRRVSSALSSIPAEKRRVLAGAVAVFAALFGAVGIVAATGDRPGVVRGFSIIAMVVAVVLGLIAWGIANSIRLDRAEASIDAAIEHAVRAHGGQLCDCEHEHDPTELHVVDGHSTDDPCAHDGAGHQCSHTCDTCVLQTLRS